MNRRNPYRVELDTRCLMRLWRSASAVSFSLRLWRSTSAVSLWLTVRIVFSLSRLRLESQEA